MTTLAAHIRTELCSFLVCGGKYQTCFNAFVLIELVKKGWPGQLEGESSQLRKLSVGEARQISNQNVPEHI